MAFTAIQNRLINNWVVLVLGNSQNIERVPENFKAEVLKRVEEKKAEVANV